MGGRTSLRTWRHVATEVLTECGERESADCITFFVWILEWEISFGSVLDIDSNDMCAHMTSRLTRYTVYYLMALLVLSVTAFAFASVGVSPLFSLSIVGFYFQVYSLFIALLHCK